MVRHWEYQVNMGKWYCWETSTFGTPEKGDYYYDCGDWRIW